MADNVSYIVEDKLPRVFNNKKVSVTATNEANSSFQSSEVCAEANLLGQRNQTVTNSSDEHNIHFTAVVVKNNRVKLRKISPKHGTLSTAMKAEETTAGPAKALDNRRKADNESHDVTNITIVVSPPPSDNDVKNQRSTTKVPEKDKTTENRTCTGLKRPNFLNCTKWSDRVRHSRAFDYLKDLSPHDFTPTSEQSPIPDVFSEATEKLLEEDRSIQRQASFRKQNPPMKYRRQKNIDDVAEFPPTNDITRGGLRDFSEDASSPRNCSSLDNELLARTIDAPVSGPTCHCYEQKSYHRTRFLPLNLQQRVCSSKKFLPVIFDVEESRRGDDRGATPTITSVINDFRLSDGKARKRDSTLSRESAASSSTVVASDEENLDTSADTGHRSGSPAAPKPSSYADIVFSSGDVTDGTSSETSYKTSPVSRSHSLDHQTINTPGMHNRFAKFQSPLIIHQSNCGLMLSTPSITVTHDCAEDLRKNDLFRFDPSMSSSRSLVTSSVCRGNESDATDDSSQGSASPTSPSGSSHSPKITRARLRSKRLQDKGTRYAERQAESALEWLKAAGFPQYAQMYEDGNFPIETSSVSGDHDFLGKELIAALLRRLSVLNKCATLKLDKATPRDIASDNEDEEYEQCALSEMWHLEEDGYRWSRMDSKASSIGSPESRLSSAGLKLNLDGIKESGNGVLSAAVDKDHQPIHYEHGKLSENSPQKNDDVSDLAAEGDAVKSKNTFLQRVGGDLKKLGSFRKKDSFQRANSVDGSIEESHFARNRYGRRNKSLRKKNDKVEIGKPVLQCGQDRLAQFRCVPIDSTGASPKDVHSLREGRKNSLHSLTSSTSSSGGASSVSTPASRIRAYTDDFSLDLGEISPGILHRNRTLLEMGANTSSRSQKDSSQDRENSVFFVPRGYKPGTFPRSLREMSNLEDVPPAFSSSSASSTRSHSASDTISAPLSHDKKSARPVSVYDNLTDTALNGNASAHDFMKPLDPGSPFGGVDDAGVYNESMETLETPLGFDAAFWGVDDIVEYASNLQQKMGTRKSENEEDDVNIPDRLFPVPTGVRLSYSTENIASLDDEADSNSITNSDPGPQPRMRWNSLKKEMSASSATSESLQLHTLSVGQLMMLRRLSLLKLTALMENYAFTSSKGTLSWSVPRFMRRAKVPDYKDKSVFGVPLLQNVQRFGQPLPLCIQHALAYLRSSALDQVGLFRKPGVKGRILKLRERCENQPDLQNFEECSVFDVADLVKQYFRELPDPLMTMKLSETFIGIFLYVPEEMRLKTLKAAIMILPDETREILKTLLCFLSDVAAHSDENRMTASNLATCFAPSLFHINSVRLMASAALPKTRKMQSAKTSSTALTKPDLKEMNENKASTTCLAFMIEHFDDMFKICEDAMTQCRLSVMQQTDDVLATEIGFAADEEDFYSDFHAYVDRTVTQTMREEQRISQNKGGWQSVASIPGSELLCKKVNDGNPLRLWRSQVEVVGADPKQIMDRILNERHLWDDDLLQWKVVQQPDEKAQLFQMECAEMSPHPTRDYCVFRSWRNDVNSRGAVAIVEVSTGQQTTLGDVRGVILTSRYVIEPTETPQRCTLTHVCRVDTKGRNPEWYNKAYGHIVTQRLMNIRNSLKAVPPKMVSSTQ